MHPFRLGPDDIDRYARLRREMLETAPWAYGSSPEDDRGLDPAAMRASLTGPDFMVFAVAADEPGGRLLSVAGLNRETRRKRRHIAWIVGVYTDPASRDRGLGRAVVTAAIEAARAWEGVASLRLGVSENAPAARRLYERLGFTPWGREPDAIRVGDATYDEIHMAMAL